MSHKRLRFGIAGARRASCKLVESLYRRGISVSVEGNPDVESESIMRSTPLPPEDQPEIKDLARAIREAVDSELNELATNLATTDDAHLFGDNEFKIRAIAHKIAAKAVEQHLARKKTATKGPA